MNMLEMNDELALRLEDPAKRYFTDTVRLRTLENAQIVVANLLNDYYLTELGVRDSNQTVTTGAVAFSALDNQILRADEGITRVQNYSGLQCTHLDLKHLKREENSYLDATTKNPMYYVFAQSIKLLPTTLTAVDIDYLKMPSPLMFNFAGSMSAAPQTLTVTASQDVVSSTDYYKGHVVYVTMSDSTSDYMVVTGQTALVLTLAGGTPIAGACTFYFITGDYYLTHLSSKTCDLNASLHELIITLAESECWAMKRDLVRSMKALESALSVIKSLNETAYTPEGIGSTIRYKA